MDKANAEQKLRQEGFQEWKEYNDPPGAHFPDHSHEKDQALVVISGSITLSMEGKTSTHSSGEYFFFPKNVIHEAKVSPEGCLYLIGEK